MWWAPTQKPVGKYVWQLPSIFRRTNLKKQLRAWGVFASLPEQGVSEVLLKYPLSGTRCTKRSCLISLPLILCQSTWLWWDLTEGWFGSVHSEIKSRIWGLWSQSYVALTLCCTSCAGMKDGESLEEQHYPLVHMEWEREMEREGAWTPGWN